MHLFIGLHFAIQYAGYNIR